MMHRRVTIRLALAGGLALWLSACSMFEEDNRRLLSRADEMVQPVSTPMRVAMAPAMIPAGTVLLGLDAAVVHPVAAIKPAADDVYELYWKPRDETPLRKAILFGPILALTPTTFAADWLTRILFPID